MRRYSIGAELQFAANKTYQQLVKRIRDYGWIGVQCLRNAELKVLSGQRSGKRYQVPGTGRMRYYKRKKTAVITYKRYTASAPGEPPAVRTGVFRTSWQPVVKDTNTGVHLRLNSSQNGRKYPAYLENGTNKMAPRPYVKEIQEMAEPQVRKIYQSLHL